MLSVNITPEQDLAKKAGSFNELVSKVPAISKYLNDNKIPLTADNVRIQYQTDSKFRAIMDAELKTNETLTNAWNGYLRAYEVMQQDRVRVDLAGKVLSDTKKTIGLAGASIKTIQGEKSDADKRASALLKQFGKIRKIEHDAT